jgi:DegV family protein with EDD domain
MAVKIITDSTCDLSPDIIKELDITVLPTYLLFGTESYRDGIDITTDEFYRKLLTEPVYPTTSQPTPQDFVDAFDRLSKSADGIVCINISAKLSGTINSAEQAKKITKVTVPLEIIDSETVSMGLGLLVVAAARMAKEGGKMPEIAEATRRMVPQGRLIILFDTLEFLAKGGRIGKVKSLLGSILNVKPIVMIKDGELVPSGQVRNRARGKDRLLEYVNAFSGVQSAAVLYSTTPNEAGELADRITVIPRQDVMVNRVGPVIATHAGPGVLGIAILLKS